MTQEIIKIGTVELTEKEVKDLISEKRFYIVTYKKIYQICHSKNAGYRGLLIHQISDKKGNFAQRGRFYAMDGRTVNDLLGYKLVVEEA